MPKRVALATYRLQFNSNFRFVDAIPVLDYLRDLGICHVYASPILGSRHGSGHGYDVTDPTNIDLDLGGEEGFAAFQAALEERGMGLLLDVVPNHMAAGKENRWWMDVLENGPDSTYASYFDIDWKPASRSLENKLLLPFLGKPFGEALDAGELQIRCHDGKLVLHYWEQEFPIAPASYAWILASVELDASEASESGSPVGDEWRGIVAIAKALARRDATAPPAAAAAERRTKFENMRDRLQQLLAASPDINARLEGTLKTLNGVPGNPKSFCGLERLIAGQHYRLAYWQTVSDAINYRRFFSITDLVGVRVDDPSVFDATHELAIRVSLRAGCAGLRIDHIDGLRNPPAYLRRLRERLSAQSAACDSPYVTVEKILARNEWLSEDWPVDSTTGYDYLNFANRLMVDEMQAAALEGVYARWTGQRADFIDTVYDKKKLVMRTLLGVEMRALGSVLAELAREDRYARELHPTELREALVEVTACLPVYRTYIQTLEVPEPAKAVLTRAIDAARHRRTTLRAEYFNFVADVLLLASPEYVSPEQREARLAFVTRWQQFTGSIMAKGFEDTALYVYYPLASLNEVGGDPRVSDADPLAFHRFISERQARWPNAMNASTTHDTKRSEDTRARIAVLSEIPADWESSLQSWSKMNEKFARKSNGTSAPDRNEEYLFYQTLVGTWPLCEEHWATLVPRVRDYLIKALREAEVHSRWTQPNEAHETALIEFTERVLDRQNNREFCASFDRFQQRTALYGMLNGLSQTLLKLACPGVPDFYQGTELWDLRLVDPDNRGLIDFEKRGSALTALRSRSSLSRPGVDCGEELLKGWRSGQVKMHVIHQALAERKRNPALFENGDYRPLEAAGAHADRVIAFARMHAGACLIVVTPRRVASAKAPVLGARDRREFWRETKLRLPEAAPRDWKNLLNCTAGRFSVRDEKLDLGDVFESFPVALLMPDR